VVVAWTAASVRADPAADELHARALFEEGQRQFRGGDFRTALRQFEQAYITKADPVFLYNVAQCYRRLGDPVAAAREYRFYLRRRPDAPNRADVEALIEDQEAEATRRGLDTDIPRPPPPPAKPPTPPPPVVSPPAASPVPAAVERHTVERHEPPRPELVAPAAPRAEEPPIARPLWKRWWLWTAVAAAAAAGITALALALAIPNDASVPQTSGGYTALQFQ
jgi:tetratricopeptide (TPR) repeat protein